MIVYVLITEITVYNQMAQIYMNILVAQANRQKIERNMRKGL
jgi:hypothetical protein